MTTSQHTLRLLLEERLGENLEEWVGHRRAMGQSWESIASELRMVTEIEVSYMSLARWYGPTQ